MKPPREFENPLCAQVDGELWFPDKGGDTRPAKSICNQCDHKVECADWGIKHEEFGVWGGLSGRERELVRRKLNIILDQPRIEGWLGNAKAG
jgi:WhiB family redox-sensing transcriptional regulator